MNRIAQFLSDLLAHSSQGAYVNTARGLFERAANTRGLSRYEAAQLNSNAQVMLSILR